jgi:hypothetical protein
MFVFRDMFSSRVREKAQLQNNGETATAAGCRVVLRAIPEGALAHCSLGDLKRFAVDLA